MKKAKLLSIIALTFIGSLFLFSCGKEEVPGPQGEQGIQGETGIGIESIEKSGSEGLVDIYTITFSDGTTSTFVVTNGKNGVDGTQGIQGIQGEPGEDGHTPVITIQEGYWYIDGENTNVLAEGIKGDTGNGVSDVKLTNTEGLVDTYTITFTDGTTSTFTVTNGKDGVDGIQGIQGEPGEDGHTPVITIENGYWHIDGVSTLQAAQGVKGETGNGISSIIKTSTEGLVDVYTITYTDGNTSLFTVTNGAKGDQGEQGIQGIQGVPGEDGHTPVITIQDGYWHIDGVSTLQAAQGVKGETGNGISSITKTNTSGLVDTYTITYTDGATSTFTVTNGKDGEDGAQGIQGEPGKDGHTPVITIQDGYWYIDGVSTLQLAQGVKGDTGNGISSITKTNTNGLVDTYTITYTDGTTSTFTVTNGKDGVDGEQGIQGIKGEKGEDGHTPVITIQDGYWYIDGVNTQQLAQGVKGDTGNGISSITKTNTSGLIDTYTITYTDGTTSTFIVTNGKDGIDGAQGIQGIQGEKGEDGHTPVITIQDGYWYIDGVNTQQAAQGVKGDTGNGISSIIKTSTSGLVDTYTITFTDGTTSTFTVTNGKDGEDGAQGIQGIQGVPGEDGHTPVITIQDGYWYIDGVNTLQLAQGPKGENGAGILSVEFNELGQLVITLTDGTVLEPVDLPKKEEHIHTFTEWESIKDPTCTQKGLTLRFCEECNYTETKYVDEEEHTYEDGYCLMCNHPHPNLENYEGKVISILGDSISTFAGYIPTADGFNLEHLSRYPQDNLLTDVNETWWMQVVDGLNAKLGVNDSWRGTTVSGGASVTSGTAGDKAAMSNLTRIQNLGSNGTPDIIIFYGGTNDLAHISEVGSFNVETAPGVVDLSTTKWDNLSDAYVNTLLRLKYYYPNSEIVCLFPTYTKSYYSDTKLKNCNEILTEICKYYGVKYIDLRYCGISVSDLPDGIHPDSAGMDYISKSIINLLIENCDVSYGENIVHKISSNLTNVTSSLGYYKGISNNMNYKTIIEGNVLDVSITMNDEDITSQCYFENVINIEKVTGDVVINIVGKEKIIYEDYIVNDIDGICSNTNVWKIIDHNERYYDGNNWIVHSSNKVYSITIPVVEGDQIWATSFQSSGNNGSSVNGIRVTWFNERGVIKSLSPNETYNETLSNGYLTAPVGATAVNIPVWNNEIDNEVYILNKEHIYENNVCISCGERCVDFSKLTFTAFGDSITYGADLIIGGRVENPYPTLVSNILGLKSYENKGVSGATIVDNTPNTNCITNTITSYTSETDIIGVLGGVNDYYRDLPLGDIDDTDTSTIYGSLHVSMSYLSENYSAAFIFYMTPYKCDFNNRLWSDDNSKGYNLEDVANAIKEVAAIYNIPVLDLLEVGGFENVMNDEDCDGVHPNQNFITNVMAPQIAKFIQDNYQ